MTTDPTPCNPTLAWMQLDPAEFDPATRRAYEQALAEGRTRKFWADLIRRNHQLPAPDTAKPSAPR